MRRAAAPGLSILVPHPQHTNDPVYPADYHEALGQTAPDKHYCASLK
jgi:hypothetical protein